MHKAAVGVFDSGIGGLTVAAEIARRLPEEDLIYLGDTARLPYGTKSAATVVRYSERAVDLLLRYPVKAVVIACNTASAHALEALRKHTDLPVLGVIEPGARAAAAVTRGGRIGVAGTEATIRSGAYQAAIANALGTSREALGDRVVTRPWPLLVPLAEEGWVDHPVTRLTIETYLAPFVEADIDTLVLGCTHYPVFKPLIRQVLDDRFRGHPMTLVDSAEALTTELATLLAEHDLRAPARDGRRSFFCTDAPERFGRVGTVFFGGDVAPVFSVDL
ncbi:MAG: glutamate racemase [Deltaproteobacteria bacterium]|nr:glutamate racemase [Deltaproteobacteria bacterium]